MEGRTFSHYRVLEKLGGGGMGVVYTALDTNLDRKVALKFLPPELTQDDAARTRLVQEAKAASALDHRNICTIYDIDESPDGQLCIAMAHYGGGTLKERLSRGALSLDDALDIAIQLADGLAEAHAAAIVHRDIKPANAVLSNTGEVKIVDFGLARVLSQVTATQSGTTRGTPGCMSPEQILGQEIRESTDVWSLGVVLYEMITARSPFRGDHAHALLYAIVHEDPPPVGDLRPDVAPELVRIVMKTLAKDPDARYRDARDLLADLRGCREAMQSAARDTRRDDAVIDPEGETQDLAPAQRGGSPVRSQEHVVGRVTQLEQLRAAYQAAAAGRGGIVCVTGEPGIGKTTLVSVGDRARSGALSSRARAMLGAACRRRRLSPDPRDGGECRLRTCARREPDEGGRANLVCANGPPPRSLRPTVDGDDRRCEGRVTGADEARALGVSRHAIAGSIAGDLSR